MPITRQEFEAMQARTMAGRSKRPIPASCTPILCVLTPLMDGFEGRESDLHDQIISEIKLRGWYYVHSRTDKRTTQAAGVPDLLIWGPNRQFWAIEIKNKFGKLTPEQAGTIACLQKLGHKAGVVRSLSEFLEFVKTG